MTEAERIHELVARMRKHVVKCECATCNDVRRLCDAVEETSKSLRHWATDDDTPVARGARCLLLGLRRILEGENE